MDLISIFNFTTTLLYRLFLLFWYWLTRVVLEKGPLNGVCG